MALVDFYADWCGPCKMLAPELETLAEEMKTNSVVKIAKVDTQENFQLAEKYKITGIPNVILFKDGQVVSQLVGLRRKDDYKQLILNALINNL